MNHTTQFCLKPRPLERKDYSSIRQINCICKWVEIEMKSVVYQMSLRKQAQVLLFDRLSQGSKMKNTWLFFALICSVLSVLESRVIQSGDEWDFTYGLTYFTYFNLIPIKSIVFLERDPLRCVPVQDSGPFNCDDQFIKWQYDYNTRQCNEFIWAGCGGNDNRFDSERECLENCRP